MFAQDSKNEWHQSEYLAISKIISHFPLLYGLSIRNNGALMFGKTATAHAHIT